VDVEEEFSDAKEVLEGARRPYVMTPGMRDLAHQYALTNTAIIKPWFT
jgi:hypothetical protein